jgi:hypothetical protein
MEELFLRRFLARNELDIVDHQNIDRTVPRPEIVHLLGADGIDHVIGKCFRGDIKDGKCRIYLKRAMPDGVQQVGLAETDTAVNEEGVVEMTRIFGDSQRRGMGKLVGRSHNVIVISQARIQSTGRRWLQLPLFHADTAFVGGCLATLRRRGLASGGGPAISIPVERGGFLSRHGEMNFHRSLQLNTQRGFDVVGVATLDRLHTEDVGTGDDDILALHLAQGGVPNPVFECGFADLAFEFEQDLLPELPEIEGFSSNHRFTVAIRRTVRRDIRSDAMICVSLFLPRHT